MTKRIKVGNVDLGNGAPVVIQSMLSTPWEDFKGAVNQAKNLVNAGCQIIRVAVPNKDACNVISVLKENITVPIVADIHFDYKIALECIERGVDKIRINPGNIGAIENVKAVAIASREKGIPIRIGVNSGSLQKEVLEKYNSPTAEALVESAEIHAKLLEQFDFEDIVISMKSSDVKTTIDAYRLADKRFSYPLHLGVTEAGTKEMGIVKSSIAIGSLLADNIGDTIRVSLTCDPIEEVFAAKNILKAVGKKGFGPNLICCPTCGRTKIDLISLAHMVEERLKSYKSDITVAVMGCVVNGPGEAKEADIGIAGGDKQGIIFKKGQVVGTYSQESLFTELFKYIDEIEYGRKD